MYNPFFCFIFICEGFQFLGPANKQNVYRSFLFTLWCTKKTLFTVNGSICEIVHVPLENLEATSSERRNIIVNSTQNFSQHYLHLFKFVSTVAPSWQLEFWCFSIVMLKGVCHKIFKIQTHLYWRHLIYWLQLLYICFQFSWNI